MRVLETILREYLRERPVFMAFIRAIEAQFFQIYLPFTSPVLDVGCGDGFFAKVAYCRRSDGINKKLIDVGLDIKDSRVEDGRKLGVYKKIVIYDGKRIPFADNYFGTVVSNCVLEHIPDLDMTIQEIYRVLKPGGIFITTVATINWENFLFGSMVFGKRYKVWMRQKQQHENLYTYKKWQAVFLNNKFKIIEETGYLDKFAIRIIDILHYFSFSSLVTYSLFKKWVLIRNKDFIFPIKKISEVIRKKVKPNHSGCIFYVLKK